MMQIQWTALVTILLALSILGMHLDCPPSSTFKCMSGYNQNDCPNGSVWKEQITLCNSCPGCVQDLDVQDPCDPLAPIKLTWGKPGANGVTPILSNQCKNGTTCKPWNAGCVCQKDSGITSCSDKLKEYHLGNLKWKPVCDSDGTFAPKQCKGTPDMGRCFCVDKEGKRIFGMDWMSNADEMNCACSRRVADLRKSKNDVTSLHCAANGNYESLQCDQGRCFCMNSTTAEVIGSLVPQENWQSLPCYSSDINGEEYLRRCDSQYVAQSILDNEMKLHGMTNTGINKVNCGYDGGFNPVQCSGDRCICEERDNTAYGSYSAASGEAQDMDCHCAQDAAFFRESHQLGAQLQCKANGNYKDMQPSGDQVFCVDKDGFPTTYPVDAKYSCCISDDGCQNPSICDKKNLKQCKFFYNNASLS